MAAALAAVVAGAVLASGAVTPTSPSPVRPHAADDMPATGSDQAAGVASNSPLLLADPNDDRFVVEANRVDAPDFSCALQVSGDRGRSWVPARPVPVLPAGAEKCYGPEVAFDREGVLFYLFVGLAGSGNQPMGAFLTTSADRGQSFTAPRQVLGPLSFGVRMAMDTTSGRRGRLHLAWLHATSTPALGAFGRPPNPVMAAYSDDGGETFSDPVQVSDGARERVVAPALVLGPNHAVHVAYYDLGGDARDYQGLEGPVWTDRWSIVLTTSSDGGRRFGPGVVVDDQIVPPERVMLIFTMPAPSLAAHGKRLCAAWTDARAGDADVALRCSPDAGRTWLPYRRVNDDPQGNGVPQYLPRLAFSPGGRLDAVFYDRRMSPQRTAADVYYTSSADGGRRFSSNLRLSQEPSDIRTGAKYAGAAAQGLVEFGSRLGLAARPDGAVAAWTDTRNSPIGGNAQDVFTATVSMPVHRPASWPRPAGAALVSAGLLGGGLVGWRARAKGRRRARAIIGAAR